jgi:peptidoglycan/LPS O-acetylase OafA/YrhL
VIGKLRAAIVGATATTEIYHERPAPSDHVKYRPDIDGLRAVAVLAVVGHHAFPVWVPGGFMGVDIFFVISGYLISTIIFGGLETGGFSYAEFYARRIRRIFPALIVVLTTCLSAGWFLLLADQYAELGKHAAAGASFVANLSLWQEIGYFDLSASSKLLLHLWSLAIEEQFYIIWPLLLGAIWRAGRPWLPHVIVTVALASFAANVLTVSTDPTAAFYSPMSRMWELIVGGLLAYLMRYRPRHIGRGSDWAAVVGFAMIVGGLALLGKDSTFPGWWAVLPTAATFLLISAGPGAWVNRVILQNPTAVWIGLISYPLYLWHWPLLAYANILEGGIDPPRSIRILLVVLSIVLAWATLRFVEHPVRRGQAVSPGKLVTFLAVLLIGGAGIYLSEGIPSREAARDPKGLYIQHYATLNKRGLGSYYREECDFYDWQRNSKKAVIAPSCTTPGSTATWLLWGDSHAQALSHGLRSILPPSVSLAQVATIGCPPRLSPVGRQTPANACDDSNTFARAQLEKLRPKVLIVAQRAQHDQTDWSEIAAFARHHGVRAVVLIGPVPQWRPSLPFVVARYHWGQDFRMISEGLDLTILATDRTLRERYGTSPDLHYVSLIEHLCTDVACQAAIPGKPPYNIMAFDYGHLAPEASAYIAEQLIAGPLLTLNQSAKAPAIQQSQ